VDENAYATFEVDGSRLANGKNVIASEVHQASRTSSDLSFALFGKAHQFPGAWVTLKTGLGVNEDEIINLNVKAYTFKIIFGSKLKKSYIIESSSDLSRWVTSQVINGTGDNVEFIPISKPTEKARFFRVRLNR
jgi:hypothetical protein